MSEFEAKIASIRALLAKRNLDALVIQRVATFAWATCGAASYVNLATTDGAAALLVRKDSLDLITNKIEAPRLEREERLRDQGWKFQVNPWHTPGKRLTDLTRGLRLAADGPLPGAVDLSAEIARLRAQLTPEEGTRFRALSGLCALAMNTAIRAVEPGMSEHKIAALLAYEVDRRGVQPIVNLVATDERISAYRHPLPTTKRLEKYAMLVLCGRRGGLVVSLTRLVYFGVLPPEIRGKAEACARVDAAMIAATRPGLTLGEVFARTQKAYEEVGYPGEWELHHQGGPSGYEPREFLATPGSKDVVVKGQAYAWNPSITGVKSEDTILIGENSNEIMTEIPGWPAYPVDLDGVTIHRPAILEME